MTLQPVDSGLLAGPHLDCRPDCMLDGGLTQTGDAPDGGSAGVPDGASDGGCSAVRCAHKTRAERKLNELRNIGAAKGWERPFSSVTEGLTDGCQLAGQKGSTCAQCARRGRASKSDSAPPRGDAWILAYGLARAEKRIGLHFEQSRS
jgi:hypothetical protein